MKAPSPARVMPAGTTTIRRRAMPRWARQSPHTAREAWPQTRSGPHPQATPWPCPDPKLLSEAYGCAVLVRLLVACVLGLAGIILAQEQPVVSPPAPPINPRLVPSDSTNRLPPLGTNAPPRGPHWTSPDIRSPLGGNVARPNTAGVAPAPLAPGQRVPGAPATQGSTVQTLRAATAGQGYRAPLPLPDGILAFDAENKEYAAKPGELSIPLVFSVTNISGREIVIKQLHPTCGCTIAKMPAQPWKMGPNDHGEIQLSVDLRGKRGILGKSVLVDSSEGYKAIHFKVVIPDRPGAMSADQRGHNFQIAAADRQAVFKNDCAKCHLEPARGKRGHELYVAACSICHDAEERAAVVPDLKALKKPTDKAFWKRSVAAGKPGSLMPAFAQDEGGPLTPDQVDSLVDYLLEAYPNQATTPARVQVPAVLPE